MAERPDPDKPQLPKLRRFRLDPDGSHRAQEVPQQNTPHDAGAAPTGSLSTSSTASPPPSSPTQTGPAAPTHPPSEPLQSAPPPSPHQFSPRPPADDDLELTQSMSDPDALLRETDENLGSWSPTPTDAHRAPATSEPPTRAAAPSHSSAPQDRYADPTTGATAAPPPIDPRRTPPGAPPTGELPTADSAPSPRSKLPLILAIVGALVVIALLLWFFVFAPSDDSDENAPSSETTVQSDESETSSSDDADRESEDSGADESDSDDDRANDSAQSEVPSMPSGGATGAASSDWSTDICETMANYQKSLAPVEEDLKEVAKSDDPDVEETVVATHAASKLLQALSVSLEDVGAPDDDALADVYDSVVDVTKSSKKTADSGASAAKVLEAVEHPLTTFKAASSEATGDSAKQLQDNDACDGLL